MRDFRFSMTMVTMSYTWLCMTLHDFARVHPIYPNIMFANGHHNPMVIKRGNGKSPIDGSSNGKIYHKWWIFQLATFGLPEGTLHLNTIQSQKCWLSLALRCWLVPSRINNPIDALVPTRAYSWLGSFRRGFTNHQSPFYICHFHGEHTIFYKQDIRFWSLSHVCFSNCPKILEVPIVFPSADVLELP